MLPALRDVQLPDRVRRVLDRGLRGDPAKRYPSLAALLREIDDTPIDVLIYECPAIQRDTHRTVRDLLDRSGARTMPTM